MNISNHHNVHISARHISAGEIWHANLKGWIHLKSFRTADGAVWTYLDLLLPLVREHTHPPHTIYPAIKFRKYSSGFQYIISERNSTKLFAVDILDLSIYIYMSTTTTTLQTITYRCTYIRTCMMHIGVASSGVTTWRGLFKVDIREGFVHHGPFIGKRRNAFYFVGQMPIFDTVLYCFLFLVIYFFFCFS